MQLKRILLTTDLSDESLRAFAPLAELARTQGAHVTLLHVVEDAPAIPHGAAFAPPLHAPAVESEVSKARDWLAAHGAAQLGGLEPTLRVVRAAEVARTIAEIAHEEGYDVIAISSHGRGGFRKFFLGSVAADVLKYADRPVMVFPREG